MSDQPADQHTQTARDLLTDAQRITSNFDETNPAATLAIATAQVHATLAMVETIRTLGDTRRADQDRKHADLGIINIPIWPAPSSAGPILDRTGAEPCLELDGELIAAGRTSQNPQNHYSLLFHDGQIHAYLGTGAGAWKWAGHSNDPQIIHEWMEWNQCDSDNYRALLLGTMTGLVAEFGEPVTIDPRDTDQVGTVALDNDEQVQYLIDTLQKMCTIPVDLNGLKITVRLSTMAGLSVEADGHYDPNSGAIYIGGDAYPVVLDH
jgi:hypothetical protein